MPTLREEVESGTVTLRWRTAQDAKVCDDCRPRHNTGGLTYEQWQAQGFPGSGWSRCKGNCRCLLVPEELVGVGDADPFEPIDFGRILEERPDVEDMDDRFRIAANTRRMRQLGLKVGDRVLYRSTRFPGMDGLRGSIESITPESLVVRFDTPISPYPEFQAVTVFDFTEVIPIRPDG